MININGNPLRDLICSDQYIRSKMNTAAPVYSNRLWNCGFILGVGDVLPCAGTHLSVATLQCVL